MLGKGAAYAQADADIRALVEKTGIPYLPMSMAKGLLPDTHEQSASAARSYVLPEADVVMLIGARLNWLLSHGKGKTWGGKDHKDWGGQKFIQVDISPQEADSNVRIDAPVVGDIGSCVSALLAGIGAGWAKPPAEWLAAIAERKKQERRQDGRDAGQESDADEFPQRARTWCATSSRPTRTRCSSTKAPTRSTSRAASSTCTSRASASTSAPGASWASAWATASPPPWSAGSR